MPVQSHNENILAHLDDSLSARVSSPNGCISILGPIQVCYTFSTSDVKICINLAGVDLGCATITTDKPCVKIGGSVGIASAEVEACFDFSSLELILTAKYCVFGSCKSATTKIHL